MYMHVLEYTHSVSEKDQELDIFLKGRLMERGIIDKYSVFSARPWHSSLRKISVQLFLLPVKPFSLPAF